jgi:signal transduction histidine kinase
VERWWSTSRRRYLFSVLVTVLGIGVGAAVRVVSGSESAALMALIPAVLAATLYGGNGPAVLCWVLIVVAAVWMAGGSLTHPVVFTTSDPWELGAFAAATAVSIFVCARARRYAVEEKTALLVLERRAQHDASQAEKSKDELLSKISHELRTPLSAIIGWTQVLRAQTPPAQVAHGLEVIERNARAQTRIIEDLIDGNQSGAEDNSKTHRDSEEAAPK